MALSRAPVFVNFNKIHIMKKFFQRYFVEFFLLFGFVNSCFAQSTMPTSGSCALLLTLPVPFGSNLVNNPTGYNFIGRLTFNSATTGSLSGRVVNPTYQLTDSPYISSQSIMDFENLPVNIEALNSSNGFTGGYKISINGRVNGRNIYLEFTGVPSNNGKSILLISSGVGTPSNPGVGPGSGVCQF